MLLIKSENQKKKYKITFIYIYIYLHEFIRIKPSFKRKQHVENHNNVTTRNESDIQITLRKKRRKWTSTRASILPDLLSTQSSAFFGNTW